MLSLLPCPDPGCGAPAEVIDRFTLSSTSGPIEHVKTRCVHRHVFLMPTPSQYLSAETSCEGSGATCDTGRREPAGAAREQSGWRPDG
jgi:hypothetical protein